MGKHGLVPDGYWCEGIHCHYTEKEGDAMTPLTCKLCGTRTHITRTTSHDLRVESGVCGGCDRLRTRVVLCEPVGRLREYQRRRQSRSGRVTP